MVFKRQAIESMTESLSPVTQEFINTPTLTAEYCRGAKTRLVFHPHTLDEAAFIVDRLQALGFKYYRDEYAQKLHEALTGAMYLDNDKTIMVGSNRDVDGTPCSVDGFVQFYIPADRNSGPARLTREDCQTRSMVFYPRTMWDARGILAALVASGATLKDEGESVAINVSRAVVQGIFVQEGRIGFNPKPADVRASEICTAADLGVSVGMAPSAEQATMLSAFNEIAARLEQMSGRIERLEDEILPKTIPKKQLPPPKRG
jgi:hypothetical protein